MHELKKYPNRRLYNTTESRYVTIEDVRKVIMGGESIHVVDVRDDSDITRSVLLQILAEQETEGHESVLTNRVIEQLIRFYGERMGGVVGRYIEQSVVAFMDHQDQWRSHLKQLNDMNPLNLMRQALDTRWPPMGRGAEEEAAREPESEPAPLGDPNVPDSRPR